MARTEVALLFVFPSGKKARIESRAARLVSTAPAGSLIEAIQHKFRNSVSGIEKGTIRMFVEVDPSMSLAEYNVRDDSIIILWVERPEDLVEPVG